MPGCAAIGCNNRSEKGFIMKCFPRNESLRTIWKKKVGRADWEPSNNSFLCSSHFDKNQWFVNASGKTKLRKDAIPTIFNITSTRKSPKKKQKLSIQNIEDNNDLDQFDIEYLDSSSSLFLNLANKKNMPNIISIQSQSAEMNRQILQNINILNDDALKSLQNENIIIVADEHNHEIGKIIKDNLCVFLENIKDKENLQILSKPEKLTSGDIKIEVKEEVHENSSQIINFDALEKKRQAICHEDSENVFDSIRNNPTPEINGYTLRNLMRKRKDRTTSECEEITIKKCKTSQSANKTNNTELKKDINNMEIEEIEVHPKKHYPIVKCNRNNSNKIIIKDNIDLSNKNVTVLPVNSKTNMTVKNVDNVNTFSDKKLTSKIEVQAKVIEKLKNQLIMYKNMESQMKNLTEELEIKNKEIEILTNKVIDNSSPAEKKVKISLSLQEADKIDLIDRVTELEGQVRSLIKSTHDEIKDRKEMECKVRCKENQIKNLNWKLDKASKILERSEKNMNNYKKKMYEMKTLLKRNHLLGIKKSEFYTIFHCYINKEFTSDALKAALEIKKACGLQGYKKLIDYDFPLPSLNLLNKDTLIIDEKDICEYKPVVLNSETIENNNKAITGNVLIEDNTELIVKSNKFTENIKNSIDNNNKFTQNNRIVFDLKGIPDKFNCLGQDNKPMENSIELIESNKSKKFTEFNNESIENNDMLVEYKDAIVEFNYEPNEDNELMGTDTEVEVIIYEKDEDDVIMEEIEYLDPKFSKKSNETVVKIVQDIFNDCSDDDDDLNDLEKHILKHDNVEDIK